MQVGALVNNAGVMMYDWTKDSFNTCYATNYEGALQLTEKLVPHLKPGTTLLEGGFETMAIQRSKCIAMQTVFSHPRCSGNAAQDGQAVDSGGAAVNSADICECSIWILLVLTIENL